MVVWGSRAEDPTVFQLAYTSLFGFHCAFLFLRTGSLLPPIFSHIFCNVMGFPQYGLHMRMFPRRRRGESPRCLICPISADGDRSIAPHHRSQRSSSRTCSGSGGTSILCDDGRRQTTASSGPLQDSLRDTDPRDGSTISHSHPANHGTLVLDVSHLRVPELADMHTQASS